MFGFVDKINDGVVRTNDDEQWIWKQARFAEAGALCLDQCARYIFIAVVRKKGCVYIAK